MRVLHIHFGREGGAERFFVALVQALAKRGIEQRFVIRPNRLWEPEIKPLGPIMYTNFSAIIAATGVQQWRVRRLCKAWEPNAIFSWMPRASKLIPDYTPAIRITRLGDFPAHLRHFKRTDILLGNLPGIGEKAKALGFKGETRTITNFPRPITPDPVDRASLDTPADAFLVAAGGRFVPRKGMDVALRAIAQMPGAYLWLIGTGQKEDELRALAAELGISDRVRFTGWVDEAIHHIAAADAFLMPSRHEPLGNMLLEAWRAGVPSVSTRSEGPDWYMRPEVDGIMTEIDDLDAIVQGLTRLRDNPVEAQTFAQNATTRLAEMFDEEAIVDAYLDLLRTDPRPFRA